MKSRPILMSAPMVRGLLDGRKTQTRRAVKLPTKTETGPIYERPDMGGWEATTHGGGGCFTIEKDGSRRAAPEEAAIWHRTCGVCIGCPYGVPGDLLIVRETFRLAAEFDDRKPTLARPKSPVWYEATQDRQRPEGWGKTRVSIHMPRWASRITLEITDVRVERLQDISEEDALAEGVVLYSDGFHWEPNRGWPGELPGQESARFVGLTARQAYMGLWEEINGRDSLDANPWVWAISFAVHPINIDEYLTRQGGN